jgi:hypothetical protein
MLCVDWAEADSSDCLSSDEVDARIDPLEVHQALFARACIQVAIGGVGSLNAARMGKTVGASQL